MTDGLVGKSRYAFGVPAATFLRETMKSDEMRNLVLSKLQKGEMPSKIASDLCGKVGLRTIKRWKSMHEQGQDMVGNRYARPLTAATRPNVKKTESLTRKKLSTRKIASKIGISQSSVTRILRHNLGLKPYKRRKIPKLTPEHIRKRKSFANWVRNNFTKETSKTILFSDEKLFDLDGVYNKQNDRIWAVSRADADSRGGIYEKSKFPQKVMVWLGVCTKGATKVVVLEGSVNHQSYIKNVLPVARQYGNKYFEGNWTFQQDGARAHTQELSQKYCRDKMPNFISKDRWPPNSPDLNPLDYCIWNEIVTGMRWDRVLCKTTLISEIKHAVRILRKEILLDSCTRWYTRVRKVGAADGAYLHK